MNDLISRQAAIDAVINADYKDCGVLVERRCRKFEEALRSLPTAQPEVTEEAVKDFCRKRCLTILTNDCFHKLTSAHIEPLTDEEKRIFLAANH